MNTGIKISLPGVNATTTTNPNQLTLNMQYPFHKLDVTNSVSFQNVNITIFNNPPFPDLAPSGYFDTLCTQTVLYKFAHGYKYVPTTWFQCQNNILNTGSGASNALNYQGRMTLVGTNAQPNGEAQAFVGVIVDTTNVYIVAQQWMGGEGVAGVVPINMVGMTFNYRIYCFAESLAPYGS